MSVLSITEIKGNKEKRGNSLPLFLLSGNSLLSTNRSHNL